MPTTTSEATAVQSSSDTVEVGEITIQFAAHGEGAEKELEEFRRELRESVTGLESTKAVVEMHSLPDFDARLSWGGSDE